MPYWNHTTNRWQLCKVYSSTSETVMPTLKIDYRKELSLKLLYIDQVQGTVDTKDLETGQTCSKVMEGRFVANRIGSSTI